MPTPILLAEPSRPMAIMLYRVEIQSSKASEIRPWFVQSNKVVRT